LPALGYTPCWQLALNLIKMKTAKKYFIRLAKQGFCNDFLNIKSENYDDDLYKSLFKLMEGYAKLKNKNIKKKKSANKILKDCFLGVIDFNEKAAIGAMEKYAKQECKSILLYAASTGKQIALHKNRKQILKEYISSNKLS
jgi:hypothetical protein